MKSAIGRFAVRHAISIVFLVLALCLGGGYAARKMGSSVFPETDFPRVVIMADNGVMPADEMMATVTRPIEEAMKDIPGADHPLGDWSRLGPNQRLLLLEGEHEADGALRAQPARANPAYPSRYRPD